METAGKMNSLKKIGDSAADLANRVKKIWLPLWKVLIMSPDEALTPASCLCLEMGKGYLEVLYAGRKFSKYTIKNRKIYRFSEDTFPSPDELASTTALAFKDFDIRKTDVVLVIPKAWVIVKPASLPAAAAETLGDVVSYEFDRFTPFNAEEALYDYIIETKTDRNIDILIAAVKANSLNAYLASLLERDIAVGRITFDVSASVTLCRFAAGQDSFDFFEAARYNVKFGSVRSGTLSHASSREFRSDDELKRAAMVEDFLEEQIVPSSGAKNNAQLIAYFTKDAAAFSDVLKTRGKLSYKILDKVDNKIAGFSYRDDMSISLAGSALEQLWPKARAFNLISKGSRPTVKRPFLITWLLVLVLIACFAIYLFVPVETEKERLSEIEHQINLRKDEVRNIEKIQSDMEAISKQMALVDEFKHSKPADIDLLKEMTLAIPKNAWLTRLRIAGSQSSIEGYAPSATPLIQQIEDSKYFHKVEFASPTFRDVRLNMDRFQIKMEIESRKPEAGSENK